MTHPRHHAKTTPDKPAIVMAETGETVTYRELDAISNRGAQALRALGVCAGDHVAFMLENRREFMEFCWAAQRAGVYYTAISRYLGAEEAAYIVENSGAKVFIASPALGGMTADLRRRIGAGVACFMVGGVAEGYASWEDRLAAAPPEPIADEVRGMPMLYSSGTTGRPKGVKRLIPPQPIDTLDPAVQILLAGALGMKDDTVYLSPAPLYHAAPLVYNMGVMSLGGTSVIMERFDPERFLALIETHRITHTQTVPTMFVRLLKMPEADRLRYDISSLTCAVHAAAPCPVEVKKRMMDWWGPIIFEYYGGTEGNGFAFCTPDEWLAHPGTVGKAIAGEIRITGEDGEELPRGQVGDVYFESDMQFEYYKDPAKTAASRHPKGWTTLGDVGRLSEDGFLHLTDRRAYTIISGGVNVYPQETEDRLLIHPAVRDAAVFGVPDEDLGEAVKAVVQLMNPDAAGPETEAELIAWCREALSAIKCPKSVDFREDMPRTETGKLMKRHLKAEYWPDPAR